MPSAVLADQPLFELLSGSHLLQLLEQHAGVKVKIEVPDAWKDPIPDTATAGQQI